ncbi:MAG: multidrug effflux MFS transporter [bacterium]|nr:multidrug effflux MFS transporter [bacterium]
MLRFNKEAMTLKARDSALHYGEFIVLVALLMSLVQLATTTVLPALPAIGADLGAARHNEVQYIVPALYLGLGLGQVAFGPLSDSIGRKPAIYFGLTLFMAGCVMSLIAPSFDLMIAGRVVQGVGIAGPRIVVVALVRDQYQGRRMARLMSFAMAVYVLVPTIAPALGQAILWMGDWRDIFAAFLGVSMVAFAWLAIRQPETLPPERRRPLMPRAVGGAVLEVLKLRAALGYTVATGCAFAPILAYMSSAQQIFQQAYTTGALFPLYFGILAVAFGGASLANGRLVIKHGMRRLSKAAALSIAVVSAIAWVPAFAVGSLPPLWLFMTYMVVVFVCFGLLFGNLNALAMEPLGHIAGVGAAAVTSIATFIALPLGTFVGQSFDGTVHTQIAAFALFGAASFTAMRWAEGGDRRRAADSQDTRR